MTGPEMRSYIERLRRKLERNAKPKRDEDRLLRIEASGGWQPPFPLHQGRGISGNDFLREAMTS